MSEQTNIEWCNHTWNPWSGCTKISAGCAYCYAAALPPKMRRGAEWGERGTRIPASDAYWREPLAWARRAAKAGERRRVFCASTADVFEDWAALDPLRERLWELIRQTPELDWLLLTKRPEVMARWAATHDWPAHVWAGTSVEDQRAADERIPHLLRVPARVRVLSCEPLLGPVRLDHMDIERHPAARGLSCIGAYWINALTGQNDDMGRPCPTVPRIHGVIVGGESGRHARPMHPYWARSLRDQCKMAGVPFFFKQWGEWSPRLLPWDVDYEATAAPSGFPCWEEGLGAYALVRVGKRAAGRLLDGRTWDGMPGEAP